MAVDKHELDVDVQELYNQEGQLLRVQGGKVLTDQQIEEEVASSAQWEERKRFKENRFYGMLQEMARMHTHLFSFVFETNVE
jgi:hypothetical protein